MGLETILIVAGLTALITLTVLAKMAGKFEKK